MNKQNIFKKLVSLWHHKWYNNCSKIEMKEGAVMLTVFDVARYIMESLHITNTWKLQKLCYYSQAWTLAWNGVPLFGEEFEAWTNGPVCPELFRSHKGKYTISVDDIPASTPTLLSDEQRENIDIVLRDYGDKEAFWLREQTHKERPWMDARGDIPEDQPCSNVITKDSMGDYYGGL